ncbi:MAG TPA: thiol:disulfide interchange protein DsbA/DsbL [Gammaproteobacteria bacterium]|nr:thiol:disulfide interchange protein DsbA/DsbL [Gammaproteobacteria bacterium]
MNCADIGSVLDQHRTNSLTAAERSNADTHLAGCERCAEQWFAHHALASERASGPRHGLFTAIVGGARSANLEPAPRRKTAPWVSGVGIAAAIALAAVIGWSLRQRGADAPHATDATGAVDPTAADTPARVERFREGEHYVQLATTRPAPDGADGIVIEEFFMYGCYHCYVFERQLEQWRAALPQNATLVPVPATFNPTARLHAQAFYTAEALGKRELHAAFYEEIHRNGDPLDSETALESFFGRFGVGGATFRAAFESPEVEARVRRAEELNREYRISATPSLVVDRKFLTSPSLAGSSEKMLAVVDDLVARESERRRPSERRTSAPAF